MREPPHRTLRATWRTPTILTLAIALILGRFALLPALAGGERFVVQMLAGGLGACALWWCASSRGKHVGWGGFLAAAVLAWFGAG